MQRCAEQLEAENRTLREDRSHSGPGCGAAVGPAVGSTGTPHPDRSGSSPDSCELAQEVWWAPVRPQDPNGASVLGLLTASVGV